MNTICSLNNCGVIVDFDPFDNRESHAIDSKNKSNQNSSFNFHHFR